MAAICHRCSSKAKASRYPRLVVPLQMDQQEVYSHAAELADHCNTSQLRQLQEPFQAYMIPQLTAQALAALRAACKSFQQIVDNSPVACIMPALQHQPAAAFLPAPSDSMAVQGRLRQQAASISTVLAAQPSSVYCIRVPPRQRVLQLHWCPTWPSQTCAVELISASTAASPSVSSLHLLDTRSMAPAQPHQLPPATLPSLCRGQLDWCLSNPTSLWALVPTDDESRNQLVVLDLACPDAINSLDCHYCDTKKWVSPNGRKAVVHSTCKERLIFNIICLPGLEEHARLVFPGSHPHSSCMTWEGQAKVRWSPSGQLVAVLWDAKLLAYQAHLGPLTIHDAHTGSTVQTWHAWAGSSQRSTYRFVCKWAPSNAAVVVAQRPRFEAPGTEGSFYLLRTNGTRSHVRMPPGSYLERVVFSPCGCFIYYSTAQNNPTNGGIVEVAPAAWEVQLPIQDALRFPSSRFFWLPTAGAQHIGAVLPYLWGYVVSPASPLREQGSRGSWSRQDWLGLDGIKGLENWVDRVVSPCGMLVVCAVIHNHHQLKDSLRSCRPRSINGNNPAFGLYIAHLRPDASDCEFNCLPTSRCRWLPKSTAWRPCSGSDIIFAIATADGSIHLLQGKQQTHLCSWTRHELRQMSGLELFDDTRNGNQHLWWSLDGSQLSVLMNQDIVIVRF